MAMLLARRFGTMARSTYHTVRRELHHHPLHGPIGPDGLPVSVDWMKHGVLPEVQNQGMCGSCWAFAMTASVESINIIKGNSLLKLSEQMLMDCVNVNSFGCSGGNVLATMKYVVLNGGIVPSALYPYCQLQHIGHKMICVEGVKISTYGHEENISDADLKALVANQPVIVIVCADANFTDYADIGGRNKGPISCEEVTSDMILDGYNYTLEDIAKLEKGHAMVAIGYGESSDKVAFWKMRNSWGRDQGMDGHWLLKRDTGKIGGAFGMNRHVVYPVKLSRENGLVEIKSESRLLGCWPDYRPFLPCVGGGAQPDEL